MPNRIPLLIVWLSVSFLLPRAMAQGDHGAAESRVEAVRSAFQKNKAVFDSFDASDPANLTRARAALGELFLAGVLDDVHALLKDGTIDKDLSRTLADVRNGMVREVMQEMAKVHKEVHVTNFSPASNLLNDIDQTFRPSERLKAERGIEQNGSALKADFQKRFSERFRIPPERMDVVSHTSEAGIPDWRASEETHDFVLALRKGSRMLSDNPEAYYLEGAFRMQVERRSFSGTQKLYSIYSYAPRADGETADVGMVVERVDGTIGKLAYKGVAPEIRKAYSAGSTVGNWWFMNAHGGGTRYCAKYGLRSFSEGPGFLVTWDQAQEGSIPQPVEYEKLASYAARKQYCDDVYLEHFRGSELTRAQLFQTLETATVIRNLGDQYSAEKAYGRRALELALGDEDAYQRNKAGLLEQADLEFRESMTQLMIRNMEVAVPERLADWLDPQVDPRVLGIPEEDVKNKTELYETEMAKGRKRLRTAALFESMHSLRVLEPKVRARVLEAAIASLAGRTVRTNRGGKYPFERSLRALAKLASSDDVPRLMQLDQERKGKKRTFRGQRGLAVTIDDPAAVVASGDPPLTAEVAAIRREIQEALAADRLLQAAAEPGVVIRTAQDAMQRWRSGLAEAEANLKWRAELFRPKNLAFARLQLNRHVWESLGWKAKGDWEALKGVTADVDPVSEMTFDREQLLGNVVNWGNANSVLSIVQAYRKGGTTSEQKAEAVRHAVLMDLAGRLPYVGDLMQVQSIMAGNEDPILGTSLMVGGFLYPGVGQAVVMYSVTKGVAEIVYEIKLAEWVQEEYQGIVPGDDGSAGPGKSLNAAYNDKPGLLHDVRAWMLMRHRNLKQELAFFDGADRREIELLLATKFPEYPTLKHVKACVYDYYSMGLEASLRSSGRPEEQWDEIQLGSSQPIIRSNEPADLVNEKDLPPMLRAFFGVIAKDYIDGTGDFEGLAAHQAAHAHPLLRELYFHTASAKNRRKAIEDLTTVMTAAYMRSLIAQAQGRETGLVVDPRWDARALTATDAYLRGIPAENLASISGSRFPQAGPAPALPPLLDVLKVEPAQWTAEFFPYFDGQLNRKLDGFLQQDGSPRVTDRVAFKLGKHHPILRPEAPENRAVAHPLLVAYFNKHVHQYWQRRTAAEGESLPETPVVAPDGETIITDDGYVFDPIDVGSVGATETTGAAYDPWPQHRFERHLRQGYKDMVQAAIVQALVADYKRGLLQDVRRRREEADRHRLDKALPAVAALGRMKDAVLGDPYETPDDRPLASELARHEFVPNLAPDEDFVAELDGAFRSIPDDVDIKITGVPTRMAGLGSHLNLRAKVTAFDVHYERPYRITWDLQGVGAGAADDIDGASASQREHRMAFEIGSAADGIPVASVRATATVTDATGKPMGTSSVTFPIGGLEAIEPEEAPVEGPGLDVGDGQMDDEDDLVVERAVYVIRVTGAGWIPHYAAGSFITQGYNDELLYVKVGADPQRLIEEYRTRLIGDICEKEMPAIPGKVKRPVIWTEGPLIDGVAGPFLTKWDAQAAIEFESTWKFSKEDGPSLYSIRKAAGCK